MLYGTYSGSENNTLFSFNPSENIVLELANFSGFNSHQSPLVLGSNGFLYGVQQQGGTFSEGNFFSFNPSTNTVTTLPDSNFSGLTGGVYLAVETNSTLYGFTSQGGDENCGGGYGCGTLFSYALSNDPNPGTTPENPFLPSSSGSGFIFSSIEIPNTDDFFFFDPEIAIGYDYIVNSGPSIAAVQLPTGINTTDPFQIWLDNSGGSCISFADSGITVIGGNSFTFASPVDCFGVRGIEIAANLDPTDPLAFVTGLQFVSVGTLDLSQTPVTFNTNPVPEPLTLFGASAAIAFGAGFKRQKSGKN